MLKKIWNYLVNIFKKIIAWFKNLFKKDKKVIFNNKEIEVVKPTLPIISGFLDIVSSVIDTKSTPSKSSVKQIDEEIKELINNLSKKNESEVKEVINKIEEKINKTKKEIRGSLKEDRAIKKELEQLDKHEQTLHSLENVYSLDNKIEAKEETLNQEEKGKIEPKKEKKTKQKENNNIEQDIKEVSEQKDSNGAPIVSDEKIEIKSIKDDENKEEQVDILIDNTPKKLLEYKEYVKYTNKVLKEGSKLIKAIVSDLSINSDMELNKIKIEELKKKIIEIRKQYYDFKHSDYIYVLEKDFALNEIDEFEIIKSSQKIDFYLNKCNSVLQTIEYMKAHEEVIKPKTKKQEEKVNEKKEKKTKKEEVPKILQEIEQANLIVIKELKQQQKEVAKFLEKLNTIPIPERKVKRLGFFSNFLNNTLRFGMGFINMFRNRNLALLTNGYIVNNRVRLMRKIINPNIDISCITFNRRIKNEIDIINSYQTICNDSLYQITSLKEEFVRSFGYDINNPELKDIFTKLVDLEEQITIQQQNLANAKIKISNSKIKIKRYNQFH